MRATCASLILLLGSVASAGEYYGDFGWVDQYDPATGLYFRTIATVEREGGFVSKSMRSRVVNLNVFNPSTGVSTLFFDQPAGGNIALVLFETAIEDGKVQFGGTSSQEHVKNNVAVAKREPRTKVLIGVQPENREEMTLLVTDKRGGTPTRVATVPAGGDWHLDVRNSKLRVVHRLGARLQIDSYDW